MDATKFVLLLGCGARKRRTKQFFEMPIEINRRTQSSAALPDRANGFRERSVRWPNRSPRARVIVSGRIENALLSIGRRVDSLAHVFFNSEELTIALVSIGLDAQRPVPGP